MDPNRTPDLADDLADLRRRIENLERRNQLTRAQADIDGTTIFRIDAAGLGAPHQHLWWHGAQAPDTELVTAGTYTAAWETEVPLLLTPHVRFTLTVTSVVSGAGDVRVTMGASTTDVVSVLAGATDQVLTCDWVHGVALGAVDTVIAVEARVTSGTGLLFSQPLAAQLGRSAGATAGGFT